MAFYFEYFPTVQYDIKKNGNFNLLTNIMLRFKIQNKLKEKRAVFYDFQIRDGQRADEIAFKYYDDERLDWIIYITNNIVDPQFDWPLDYRTFTNFIKEKYTSIESAKSTIHHYEKILNTQSILADGTIIPERYVEVDETTYNLTSTSSRRVIYNYDYEDRINEKKRNIKILQAQYVDSVIQEVEDIFK